MTKTSLIAAILLGAVTLYGVSSAAAADFVADNPMDAPDAAPATESVPIHPAIARFARQSTRPTRAVAA